MSFLKTKNNYFLFSTIFLFFFFLFVPLKYSSALTLNPGTDIGLCTCDGFSVCNGILCTCAGVPASGVVQPACYNAPMAYPTFRWRFLPQQSVYSDGSPPPELNLPPASQAQYRIRVWDFGCGVVYTTPYIPGVFTRAYTLNNQLNTNTTYTWGVSVIDNYFSETNFTPCNASVVFITSNMCAPAAPTGVSVSADTCTQLRVVWTDNSNAPNAIEDHFDIELNRANPLGINNYTDNASPLVINDAFVLDGATYFARVKAENKDGVSSAWVASPSIVAPLCTPVIGAVSSANCNSVTVNWTDNSRNEDGYRIIFTDLDPGVNGNDSFVVNVPGNAVGVSGVGMVYTVDKVTFPPNGVPDGVDWNISVVARKGAAVSPSSAQVPVTTILCTPGMISSVPAGPQCGRINTQGIDPSPHNNEDEFRIYFIDRDPVPNGNEVGFLPGGVNYDAVNNVNNVNTSDVPDGVRWDVYIVAYNTIVGESPHSASAFPVTKLCAPKNINVTTGPACNQVSVSWDDESLNEDDFEIRLIDTDTGAGNTTRFIATDGDNETGDVDTINIVDALDGVNWSVTVRAVNAVPDGASPSDWSSADTGTTILCAPTNLNALEVVCSEALGWLTNLIWDDHSNNESAYEIWVDTDTGTALTAPNLPWVQDPYSPAPAVVGGNLTVIGAGSWTVTMPASVDAYRYMIRAIKPPFVVPSAWSNIEVRRSYFCNPKILPITDFNCDYATFSWDLTGTSNDAEVDEYRIYRTIFNDPYGGSAGARVPLGSFPDINPGGPETFTDNDIMSAVVSYTYEVEAYCLAANCPDYKGAPGADVDILLSSFNMPVLNLPCGELPTKWWEAR